MTKLSKLHFSKKFWHTDWLLVLGIISLIVLFTVLVLGKDVSHPLMSYDEAWYGAVSQDMVAQGNILYQTFNGYYYYDHPPLGFWLMALAIKAFGNNEIAVRLPSIIAGCLSLVFVYLLARRRSNSWFGLVAAIMLASSLWFVYRTRSGNLDVLLVCFFLTTYYFAERWFEYKNSFFSAIGLMLSLSCLLLTKTLVGFAILPVIIFSYVLTSKSQRPPFSQLLLVIGTALVLCVPWYWFNAQLRPGFLRYHFFSIGTRDGNVGLNKQMLTQILLYLRSGIGKWYYPVLLSLAVALTALFYKHKQRTLLLKDVVLIVCIAIPFLLSPKTEIWHLIPLYAPLYLLTTTLIFTFVVSFFSSKHATILLAVCFLGVLFVGSKQSYAVMDLLSQNAGYTEADIAAQAKPLVARFYLNGPFLPAFVYYSEKEFVDPLWLRPNAYQFMVNRLVNAVDMEAFVVTRDDAEHLEDDAIPHGVYAENSDYLIITTKP